MKTVRTRLGGMRGQAVLEAFREVWEALLTEGILPLQRYEAGLVSNRQRVDAGVELRGLRESADPHDVLINATALFLFREREPRQFLNHDAFVIAMARIVRKQGSGAYDLVWNETEQRYAKKLRGMRRGSAIYLGQFLTHGLAPSCGHLALQIIAEEDAPAERARRFTETTLDLKEGWKSQRPATRSYPYSKTPQQG